MNILNQFTQANIKLSNLFDLLTPQSARIDGNTTFIEQYLPRILIPESILWDVGSGSRPLINANDKARLKITIVGLDISASELNSAPSGSYDKAVVADICSFTGESNADTVVCQALLEHVPDTAGAIRALSSITKPGGKIYIFAPSRNALFARINIAIPEQLKRKILFTLFPSKAQGHDGFKAWYDNCTPRQIEEIAKRNGLIVEERRLFWISSYFKALLPAFIIWRITQFIAWLLIREQAAETFIYVLSKPLNTSKTDAQQD